MDFPRVSTEPGESNLLDESGDAIGAENYLTPAVVSGLAPDYPR
jgi:hypothetical protein